MTILPAHHPLTRQCRLLLAAAGCGEEAGELLVRRLPASRPVFCFSAPDGTPLLVGKFFTAYPPVSAPDRALATEFRHYQDNPAWARPAGVLPRCLGQAPDLKLGLLVEYVAGPDLDACLARARDSEAAALALQERLARLAQLLAWFHTRPLPPLPVSPLPATLYLGKLAGQLEAAGLLCEGEARRLTGSGAAWEAVFAGLPDRQVLLHGDATPTNFLFPDGAAVAVDLERLRPGDRLFDLGWVAGELWHAFAWRFQDGPGAGPYAMVFFQAYLEAVAADGPLARRLHRLAPFYKALALLRIARNAYLAWEHRCSLVQEARRLLASPRSLP